MVAKRRRETTISIKPKPVLKKGTEVNTPGGYTARVIGHDPQDSSRVKIRYTGQQAWMGDDSYPPYALTIANLPPEMEAVKEVSRERTAKQNPGDCPEPTQPDHNRNRNSSKHSSCDRSTAPIQTDGSEKSQVQPSEALPLEADGLKDRIPFPRSQVQKIRPTGWIATTNGEMLNPLQYEVVEDGSLSLSTQIAAIRKSGPVMPTGCWIESYKATRILQNGDRKQYTYYRVKAYEPIFEAEDGTLKRSKNLGDASSAVYQDWCDRRQRREDINRLQRQLEREQKNKAPSEMKFGVVEIPQAWFDEEINQFRWDGIPDEYEPTETYRHYRKKTP